MQHHPFRSYALIALCILPMLAARTVAAAPITISNPSFEQPVTPPDSFIVGATAPTGWTSFGNLNMSTRVVGVVNPNDTILYVEPVPDGDNVGVTFFQNFSGDEAGMQQTLAATLQLSTGYTLTVEIGNMASAPPPNDFDFDGFPGYRVELLAGGVVIASDENTAAPGEGRFLTSTVEVTTGNSHPQAGQALGIRLTNLDAAPGTEVNFDDVQLDATPFVCPELPPSGCKAASTGRSSLSFAEGSTPERSAGSWLWKGAATTLEELDSPATTTTYLFCVYEGEDDVAAGFRVSAGGTCGGNDCWTTSASGFRYKDRDGANSGLTSLQLKAGDDGKALIKLKARGGQLDVPSLPLDLVPSGARAVLLNEESGDCWEASYSATLSDPADTNKWKARSD
jgi:hapalindole H/12-epi-hapalindole U/12-epi-fischerindole U synthase